MPSVIDDYKSICEKLRQIGHQDPFRDASKPKVIYPQTEEPTCALCDAVGHCTGSCIVGY